MEKWGATLLGIGILSYVAPLFGIQFQLVNLLGDTPGARIGMIVVGGVLLFLGRISGLGNSGSTEVANSDVPQLVPPTPRRRPASGVSASTAGSHFCPTCASPNGVDLSVLRCNSRGLVNLLPASVAASWLFQFWILGVSSFDSARLVAASAISHQA
jgi:hypothetical protein